MQEWIASEVSKHSLPPRRITALPDFRQSAPASAVTFGLDSYIMPITPIGMHILPTIRPFGLFHIFDIPPTGSGRAATSRSPAAMEAITLSDRVSLSSMAFVSPLLSAALRSFMFSALRKSALFSNSPAIFRSALFFVPVSSLANRNEAARAARATLRTSSLMDIF